MFLDFDIDIDLGRSLHSSTKKTTLCKLCTYTPRGKHCNIVHTVVGETKLFREICQYRGKGICVSVPSEVVECSPMFQNVNVSTWM